MDIITAQGILAGEITTKEKELDALKLAQSILSDTYQPEFTSRENALKEAAESLQKLDAELTSHSATKTQLAEEKTGRLADVQALNAVIADKDAVIADLQRQLEPQ